jgi:hypothetical protein
LLLQLHGTKSYKARKCPTSAVAYSLHKSYTQPKPASGGKIVPYKQIPEESRDEIQGDNYASS